ncbi:hypothetical protein MAP00_003736 [Monascus purpureus]|nr:hypothetical protein MAP00_003736 [Monascus purpureus]
MSDPYPEPPCPFCAIASNHPPSPPSQCSPEPADKESTAGKAFIVLSTKYLLAFLDIMPLSRGHVLVVTRKHYRTLDKVGVELGMELGKWLPVVSRVVNKTVTGDVGDGADSQPHWNVVQNNGEWNRSNKLKSKINRWRERERCLFTFLLLQAPGPLKWSPMFISMSSLDHR